MATLAKSLPSASSLSKRKSTTTLSALPPKTLLGHAVKREPVAAAKAKAHFLQLLDQVERDRIHITITKRGRIVAQLTPAPDEPILSAFDQVFGSMKGSVKISGDIISPDHEAWGPKWK